MPGAVDRVRVTTVVDNYIDNLRQDTAVARRYSAFVAGKMPDLRAEHGLAHLVEITRGRDRFTMAFDFGLTPDALNHNFRELAIDPSAIDALGLSHGHRDHWGGLTGFLHAWRRRLRRDLPLYGGVDHFGARWRQRGERRVYSGRISRAENGPSDAAVTRCASPGWSTPSARSTSSTWCPSTARASRPSRASSTGGPDASPPARWAPRSSSPHPTELRPNPRHPTGGKDYERVEAAVQREPGQGRRVQDRPAQLYGIPRPRHRERHARTVPRPRGQDQEGRRRARAAHHRTAPAQVRLPDVLCPQRLDQARLRGSRRAHVPEGRLHPAAGRHRPQR